MKKLYTLLFLLLTTLSFGQTIYSENMGTPSGNTLIPAYSAGTTPATFQNSSPIIYSGNGDVRTSSPSNYPGASGSGNVWFSTSAPIRTFQIEGINTSSYNTAELQLKFGYLTSNVSNHLIVEQSSDGATYTPISYTQNTTTNWTLVTVTGGILSTPNLRLRFTQSAQTVSHRLDDISLTKISASCTLVIGTATTNCNASTLGTDTYTVTIPYTGGGNATYTITPNSGVVSGDNPTSVAAGNITITGVSEGTNFSATITGGTCSLLSTAPSPECKPINALPFTENFNYTVGNSLGAEQKWTNVNTGDIVAVTSGNLAYTGITSSGNSVSFVGAGMDPFTPFTAATSGTVYYSFLMNITDLSNVTVDLTETYFVGLTDAQKNYMGRLFVKKNGTQYNLGFDSASTTTNYDATLRNAGEVVLVIMGYDFASNKLSAWFNPDLSTFSAATPATLVNTPSTAVVNLGGLILRQDSDTKTPAITIDELKISTSIPLSTKQNTISGLNVYPNPVKDGNLYLTSNSNEVKTVAFYDVLGKEVLNTKTSNNAVNVSNLKKGAYILKITENGNTDTKKLIIE
ncbi:T9SS type A sorting domain-containing protein [Flavobacterium nackdongense]|uniref:T9SS type A sorting domain-containing protein n=1 Tax=Flavobacterium nackdongense TaxID=2547394 RepID=A0A4P6Y9E1_9FLAO|nr:T9SS type A sorting domain-containing protein [Flavobacterium nackdongense]QBN19576.1 T9SS type A sorting domain-containing protein [Flavobacterium nackdongense]